MGNNATLEKATKLPADLTSAFLFLKRGAYLQGSIHSVPHYLAFRLDLIKKAVACL